VKISVLQGDITTQRVDAVVNAANTELRGGGGVDGAIHRAAGPELTEACARIRAEHGGCPTGKAVITGAGRLPCRFVIHTPGPVWHGGRAGEPELLADCYHNCLHLAEEHGVRSIAFPAISCGVYGYPVDRAAGVAFRVLAEHRGQVLDEVRLVLFNARDYRIYCRVRDQLPGP
jgi:O-acetyl-ADP-ribose deacetylase (regulator of RNase III)